MVQHYMQKAKKQFKTFKRKHIEMKIEDAKKMYEDLDSKLDEVTIGVVRIEEAAAAKIQDITSSEKFQNEIDIQARECLTEFLEDNPEDVQKEIRQYLEKQSPAQNALFDYVSDLVDAQIN